MSEEICTYTFHICEFQAFYIQVIPAFKLLYVILPLNLYISISVTLFSKLLHFDFAQVQIIIFQTLLFDFDSNMFKNTIHTNMLQDIFRV